jgi:tetratricopeptide (TPR) repeat protein
MASHESDSLTSLSQSTDNTEASGEILLHLARIYALLSRPQEALDCYHRAVSLQQNAPSPRLLNLLQEVLLWHSDNRSVS